MKRYLMLLMLFVVALNVSAQEITVKITEVKINGNEIPAVSISKIDITDEYLYVQVNMIIK